jgi:uncharacterized membrane protein
MNEHRLEAYTDGIFAIAATLLVLNFAVPIVTSGTNAELLHGLVAEWPKLLAFLLSFGVITNYWRMNSALFRGVRVADHKAMTYNLILLVTAALVPYATNVAGTYPTLPAAAVLYSVTLLVAALAGFFLSRNHLLCLAKRSRRREFRVLRRGTHRAVVRSVFVSALFELACSGDSRDPLQALHRNVYRRLGRVGPNL